MFPVEKIDTRNAPEETLRALHDLYLVWESERVPHDPPTPWEQRLVDWRHVRDFEDVPRWIAWDGNEVVATAGVYHHRTQDLDNTWGWVFVRPEQRRRGVGSMMAAYPVAYSDDDGRKRFAVGAPKHSEFGAVAERAGLKPVYNERVSQVSVSEVDRSLMRSWIDRASERAGDYELLFLPMPVPAEHRARMIDVMGVMNTAPLEDFEEEPMEWDDGMLDDVEKMEVKKQRYIHTCVARHKPTGDFVGYTSLVYQSLHPAMAHQWDTGVSPDHRNRGLGRWLKAAMFEQFVEEHPDVVVIETENAESNDPMLNINVAMGFRPSYEEIIYQGETAGFAQYLANR